MTVPLGLHQGPLQPPSPEIGPPSPELGPSSPELGPSSNELGPPYPELGSLSPFIVPLSPELGPPSPELGPPSPELGPPSPELGPPSSELGPPSLAQPPSPELRSCASSSDSTTCVDTSEADTVITGSGITFPFENPEEGSWVGVRVDNYKRKHDSFKVYIARTAEQISHYLLEAHSVEGSGVQDGAIGQEARDLCQEESDGDRTH
ncbi:hypothetical protein Pcinc_006308 [Petrolisthes cinctipes]|uniref:Uncharacterized protein n=1 Tax=Petrolisthes cinctipes TaxID=88211 RepID=A0AAE1GHP2_PETCI|nr:hypothetical protein Pcinc_006308 [Petrolisthes cinctipes]